MHNLQPNDGFEPEHFETDHLDLLLAMALLHEFFAIASDDDAAAMGHRMSLLSNQVRLETRPYLQLCTPDDQNSPMSSAYEQMVLRPRWGTTARTKVSQIIARFPHFEDYEQPFDLPEDAARWNDVSLEMTFRDGKSSRYWLNSKGCSPYRNTDDLDFDYPRSLDATDLYAVQESGYDRTAPVISGSELRMLLRLSNAMSQPDNPEDE